MSSSSNEALGINKRFWRKTKLGSQDYTAREQQLTGQTSADGNGDGSVAPGTSTGYRTYKRRWFGFVQLTLMNIMVSWDVSRLISFTSLGTPLCGPCSLAGCLSLHLKSKLDRVDETSANNVFPLDKDSRGAI
jgi:hypothetical protein